MGDQSSASYIHMVHRLIEECIVFNMSKEECMEALSKHANIKPVITSTVWKELEKENKEFFEEYAMRRKEKSGASSTEDGDKDDRAPQHAFSSSPSTRHQIRSSQPRISSTRSWSSRSWFIINSTPTMCTQTKRCLGRRTSKSKKSTISYPNTILIRHIINYWFFI